MRAAIYARVSRKEGQNTENQLRQLQCYALDQKWEVILYVNHESGKTSDRAAFQKLFEDASRHLFSVVLVWALDRFTREGVAETFIHIQNCCNTTSSSNRTPNRISGLPARRAS